MAKNWVHQEGGLDVYCETSAFPATACVLVDKNQLLPSTPECSHPLQFTFIPVISWGPRAHASQGEGQRYRCFHMK